MIKYRMLAYEESGHGPPLVLLHAYPLSSQMWEAQRHGLSDARCVIAPDLPGFGRSPRLTPPSIAGMASAVLSLLDRLHVREPVIVGGLSMGGYVAFEILRQAPDRVRALGLFSTRAGADAPPQREARVKTIEKIQRDGLAPVLEATLPKLVGKTTLEQRPAVVARVRELMQAQAPEGVADALAAMGQRADSSDLLPGIRVPTLILAGDEDTFIPLDHAQQMQRQIPGARLDVITEAGHLINLEQPAAFQDALRRWVAGIA